MDQLSKQNDVTTKASKDHKGWRCWRATSEAAKEIVAKKKMASTVDDIKERMASQHKMKEYPVTTLRFEGQVWERKDGKLVALGK